MQCFVYKSLKRPDTYIYLAKKDGFDVLPQSLSDRFGVLELALEFELLPNRRLARTEASVVIQAINDTGFYLQLPPSQVISE